MPASVKCEDVDCVVVVDEIGDPKRIGTKEARVTQDPRELMMAERAADVIAATRGSSTASPIRPAPAARRSP